MRPITVKYPGQYRREKIMEKLRHLHPWPNCPACEQVGMWKAEARFQVAEEIARVCQAIKDAADDRMSLTPGKPTPLYDKLIVALYAWEKTKKGDFSPKIENQEQSKKNLSPSLPQDERKGKG